MPDIYLGDIELVKDGDAAYLSDTQRVYRNGDVLELQEYEGGTWVVLQSWGE